MTNETQVLDTETGEVRGLRMTRKYFFSLSTDRRNKPGRTDMPTCLTLDPKTGATVLVPVTFTCDHDVLEKTHCADCPPPAPVRRKKAAAPAPEPLPAPLVLRYIRFALPGKRLSYVKLIHVVTNRPIGTPHTAKALRVRAELADIIAANLAARGYVTETAEAN